MNKEIHKSEHASRIQDLLRNNLNNLMIDKKRASRALLQQTETPVEMING